MSRWATALGIALWVGLLPHGLRAQEEEADLAPTPAEAGLPEAGYEDERASPTPTVPDEDATPASGWDSTPEPDVIRLPSRDGPSAAPALRPRSDRFPPPKDALVLFFPGLLGPDPVISAALSAALSEGLHAKRRYHVVELRDTPAVGSRAAAEVWASCEVPTGCLTLLGDMAQADISVGGVVTQEESGDLKVHITLYDLEWGEEIPGLDLRLPGRPPLADGTPSPEPEAGAATPTPAPAEPTPSGTPTPPVMAEASEGLILALDARLIPVAQRSAAQAAALVGPWQVTPTPPPLEGSESVALDGDVDALAAQVRDQRDKRTYTAEEMKAAEAEREILGVTPRQYLRIKRMGITEREWQARQVGRAGQVAVRIDGGILGGEVSQQYDGIVLMGEVSTDILEKYARLIPAAGRSPYGRIGLSFGMLPDLEAEIRIGLGQSDASVRTLQTFQENYCPAGGGEGCVAESKEESIPTRVVTFEWLGRYYFRRPWDLKPYGSLGVQVLRMQDISAAYDLHSTFSFPAIYDPFPPLFTFGLSGAAGALWQAFPNVAFTAEVPVYLRLISGASDPLHFYAETPLVGDPPTGPSPRVAAGLTLGLHMRLR